jgi:hypothetical protein
MRAELGICKVEACKLCLAAVKAVRSVSCCVCKCKCGRKQQQLQRINSFVVDICDEACMHNAEVCY